MCWKGLKGLRSYLTEQRGLHMCSRVRKELRRCLREQLVLRRCLKLLQVEGRKSPAVLWSKVTNSRSREVLVYHELLLLQV